jgi:hypothetical protein
MVRIIEASARLCRNNDKTVANNRIIIIGLLNWPIKSENVSDRFWGFRRFGP